MTTTRNSTYVGTVSKADIDELKDQMPSQTWFIHNNMGISIVGCKWCGDNNHHAYIDGACWKCWRNRHPGALA